MSLVVVVLIAIAWLHGYVMVIVIGAIFIVIVSVIFMVLVLVIIFNQCSVYGCNSSYCSGYGYNSSHCNSSNFSGYGCNFYGCNSHYSFSSTISLASHKKCFALKNLQNKTALNSKFFFSLIKLSFSLFCYRLVFIIVLLFLIFDDLEWFERRLRSIYYY